MAAPKPLAPIRRFDVFAEYKRLRGLKEEGLAASKAKGYGLWLAKIVAAQKFGRMARSSRANKGKVAKRNSLSENGGSWVESSRRTNCSIAKL